jgi:hypothetical protein
MIWLAGLNWPVKSDRAIPDQVCFMLGTVFEVCFDSVALSQKSTSLLRPPQMPKWLQLPDYMGAASEEAKIRTNIAKSKGLLAESSTNTNLESPKISESPSVEPWKRSMKEFADKPVVVNFVGVLILGSILVILLEALVCTETPAFLAIEITFTTLFAIEFIVRFMSCEAAGLTKVEFSQIPTNICDFLALLPLFIDLIVEAAGTAASGSGILRFLRMARLLRLARILRLQRYRNSMKIVGPICMIFTVSWAIFLLEKDNPKYAVSLCEDIAEKVAEETRRRRS